MRNLVAEMETLFSPEWSDGGWRGNGDDASPSAYRNASSGTTPFRDGDPRIAWAANLAAKIQAAGAEAKSPTRSVANLIDEDWLSYAWPGVCGAIGNGISPDSLDEVERRIYDKLSPPPPFTPEQRTAVMLRWRADTGCKKFLTTNEDPTVFSEEVLLAELSRQWRTP